MKKPGRIKDFLKNILTEKEIEIMPSSFDIVGDIMIFADFPEELAKKEKKIGEALLKNFRNVKVVVKKTKKYSGKFRTPTLKIIAGERRKETVYRENNSALKLNVEKVYFSSRLSTERKRIYGLVKDGESVLVMFSGCAVYPIVIARNTKAKEICGIEINPVAHRYAMENLKLNKTKNINLFLGDVRDVMPKIKKRFDRVLMPLPKGAENYLDLAVTKIKKGGTIHLYSFFDKESINEEFLNSYLKKYVKKFKISSITKCGQFSPSVFRVCVDFSV